MDVYPITGFSDPVSSMTHLFSAPIYFSIGMVTLWRLRGNVSRTMSLSIFIFAVVFLLSISGVFHLLSPGTHRRLVLQMLDHAAIFILIAATFTPTHVLLFKGFMRWGMLLVIWGIAIIGISLKSIYFDEFPEGLSLALYLCMGWIGIITGYKVQIRLGMRAIAPLIYGAIAYTVGAILEFVRYPTLIPGVLGPHELFHLLVLVGISFHWQFVYRMARWHKLNTSD